MTQDRYLGRKLTDRRTAEALESLLGSDGSDEQNVPKVFSNLAGLMVAAR